jgi:hypothetical protein
MAALPGFKVSEPREHLQVATTTDLQLDLATAARRIVLRGHQEALVEISRETIRAAFKLPTSNLHFNEMPRTGLALLMQIMMADLVPVAQDLTQDMPRNNSNSLHLLVNISQDRRKFQRVSFASRHLHHSPS